MQILLLVRIEANITACKDRYTYYCLQKQKLILLLVRIEANITNYKKTYKQTLQYY